MAGFAGGVRASDAKVFPPRRPKDAPQNAVWVEAPPFPISWHRGVLRCETPQPGTASYSRLVMPNGTEVYGCEYLPCEDRSPVPMSKINLVPPRDGIGLWIADKRLKEASIGTLRQGR